MKPSKKKKKKRSRGSKPPSKDVAEDEEIKVLNRLKEAFASVSLEQAASAYREADGDPDKAAKILGGGGLSENADDRTACSSSIGCSGSGSSSSSSWSEGFVESNSVMNPVNEKGFRGNKSKKVVVATGTISTVLGKDYVMSYPRRDSNKPKRFTNGVLSKEAAEQFLCSMLGDGCELSIGVVRDVLCHCGYDVEKALDALLDLSASSYKQLRNSRCSKEDTRFLIDVSDNLTDRASDSTSHSSESELQDNVRSMDYGCRNYAKVLVTSEARSPTSLRSTESNLPQKVLESLFNIHKSSEHEPSTMNWRNVVKKMESLGQGFDFCPSGITELQQNTHAKGDEYQLFRKAAKQQWDSMRSYYQKAATAYSKGQREYAAYLSEQGKVQSKMAREADEKASQEIFKARNKSIENVITIDMHGQHVKQAIRLLKLHLLFGTYVPSVQYLRVITGCGTHGVGKSKLKQSVINLVENEGIGWSEENRGTVLIRLDGQREFSFLDSESDTE